MADRLLLYELDCRESVAYIDKLGMLYTARKLPKILFADVPIIIHTIHDITLAPMHHASSKTGPEDKIGDIKDQARINDIFKYSKVEKVIEHPACIHFYFRRDYVLTLWESTEEFDRRWELQRASSSSS